MSIIGNCAFALEKTSHGEQPFSPVVKQQLFHGHAVMVVAQGLRYGQDAITLVGQARPEFRIFAARAPEALVESADAVKNCRVYRAGRGPKFVAQVSRPALVDHRYIKLLILGCERQASHIFRIVADGGFGAVPAHGPEKMVDAPLVDDNVRIYEDNEVAVKSAGTGIPRDRGAAATARADDRHAQAAKRLLQIDVVAVVDDDDLEFEKTPGCKRGCDHLGDLIGRSKRGYNYAHEGCIGRRRDFTGEFAVDLQTRLNLHEDLPKCFEFHSATGWSAEPRRIYSTRNTCDEPNVPKIAQLADDV